MRPARSFFAMLSTYFSGLSFAICAHSAFANARASGQVERALSWLRQRRHDMQAFAARGLAEMRPARARSDARGFPSRRRSPPRKAKSGAGSRSNTSRPGTSGPSARNSRDGSPRRLLAQRRRTLRHDRSEYRVWDRLGPCARDQSGCSRHGVALEKALAVEAVAPDDGAGSSFDVLDEPLAYASK